MDAAIELNDVPVLFSKVEIQMIYNPTRRATVLGRVDDIRFLCEQFAKWLRVTHRDRVANQQYARQFRIFVDLDERRMDRRLGFFIARFGTGICRDRGGKKQNERANTITRARHHDSYLGQREYYDTPSISHASRTPGAG